MGVCNCKPNPAKTNQPRSESEERLCFLHALERPRSRSRSRSICEREHEHEHEQEPTDRQQLSPSMSVDGGSCFGVVKVEKLQSENALNAISGGRRSLCESLMSELVARTGRHLQRYKDGCRLVAGCIPFKYRSYVENGKGTYEKVVEVLMVSSTSGPGLVFPKGGWENDETVEQAAVREAIEEAGVRGELMQFLGYYSFNKSKSMQHEFCPQGVCKAAMFGLLVKEELQSWPEQSTRQRSWLSIPEATECCRHPWMRKALEEGFLKWHVDQMISKPQIKE